MKVSELEGSDLDYWVAKAEGATIKPAAPYAGFLYSLPERPNEWRWLDMFNPSSKWSHAGPIIEREKIEILHPGEIFVGGEWTAGVGEDSDGDWAFFGQASSPLVAAMRAYVSSKFGDEVDSPQTYQQEK